MKENVIMHSVLKCIKPHHHETEKAIHTEERFTIYTVNLHIKVRYKRISYRGQEKD